MWLMLQRNEICWISGFGMEMLMLCWKWSPAVMGPEDVALGRRGDRDDLGDKASCSAQDAWLHFFLLLSLVIFLLQWTKVSPSSYFWLITFLELWHTGFSLNICFHVSWVIARCETAGLYNIWSISVTNSWTVFQSGCTMLLSHQWCMSRLLCVLTGLGQGFCAFGFNCLFSILIGL